MLGCGGRYGVGQRHTASLAALRQGEDELPVDDPDLSADVEHLAVRVEVVGTQSE
jgi:hypothetical protein